MARTPGSGWGAGPMLWQICEKCGQKKALYTPIEGVTFFRCSNKKCNHWFKSDTLLRFRYKSQKT